MLDNVNRLAGIPTHKPYNVAVHSYHTGLIFMDLCDHYGKYPSFKVVQWVFRHDMLEAATGDLLYPAKNLNDETKIAWRTIEDEVSGQNQWLYEYSEDIAMERFTDFFWNLFKAADLYELFLFCTDEYEMGNRNKGLLRVLKNCMVYLADFKVMVITQAVHRWRANNWR
jgi:5'-deoxynucleotidase YfbR-like HD superfamily hydrolase